MTRAERGSWQRARALEILGLPEPPLRSEPRARSSYLAFSDHVVDRIWGGPGAPRLAALGPEDWAPSGTAAESVLIDKRPPEHRDGCMFVSLGVGEMLLHDLGVTPSGAVVTALICSSCEATSLLLDDVSIRPIWTLAPAIQRFVVEIPLAIDDIWSDPAMTPPTEEHVVKAVGGWDAGRNRPTRFAERAIDVLGGWRGIIDASRRRGR
jgi:hypothetical protein